LRVSASSVSDAWPFGRLRANLSGVEGWRAVGVGPHRDQEKEDVSMVKHEIIGDDMQAVILSLAQGDAVRAEAGAMM
jgi:hypothetical protein